MWRGRSWRVFVFHSWVLVVKNEWTGAGGGWNLSVCVCACVFRVPLIPWVVRHTNCLFSSRIGVVRGNQASWNDGPVAAQVAATSDVECVYVDECVYGFHLIFCFCCRLHVDDWWTKPPPQCHNVYPPFHSLSSPPTKPPSLIPLFFLLTFSQTTRSRRARSRRRTRCTPPRCGATGWWPRRCPQALAWPPAPSAPAPSSAGYLEDGGGWGGGRMDVGLEHQVFRNSIKSSTDIEGFLVKVRFLKLFRLF